MKHDFVIFSQIDNPVFAIMALINNATNHLFAYGMIVSIFIVSLYVFMRRTNDIGKSLVSSMHIITLLTAILYYAGKIEGIIFISDIFMLSIVVLESIALAGIYFMRVSQNG